MQLPGIISLVPPPKCSWSENDTSAAPMLSTEDNNGWIQSGPMSLRGKTKLRLLSTDMLQLIQSKHGCNKAAVFLSTRTRETDPLRTTFCLNSKYIIAARGENVRGRGGLECEECSNASSSESAPKGIGIILLSCSSGDTGSPSASVLPTGRTASIPSQQEHAYYNNKARSGRFRR